MMTINYNNNEKLNTVGGRYVKGNRYVDVTDNYYCYGTLDAPLKFGMGTECTEAEAHEWLRS